MAEIKPHSIRVVDFVAESLEAEASGLPPSEKAKADNLRQTAEIMRKSNNPRRVRVWEEKPGRAEADFIRPDPAAHD